MRTFWKSLSVQNDQEIQNKSQRAASVAQLVRALCCEHWGRGFESHRLHPSLLLIRGLGYAGQSGMVLNENNSENILKPCSDLTINDESTSLWQRKCRRFRDESEILPRIETSLSRTFELKFSSLSRRKCNFPIADDANFRRYTKSECERLCKSGEKRRQPKAE